MKSSPITRRLLHTVLAISPLVSLPAANAQQQFAPSTLVQQAIDARIASKRTMGLVVGVLDQGSTPRILTSGISGIAGVPLDGNTVFEIGSITKVFTGAVLADMVARGEVSLSDPVAKYLPKTVRMPVKGGKQITLLDLATQTSGLPRLPENLKPADAANPYADYSVAQLYEFLSGYTLTRNAGDKYEYSNLGVGLLGHVLSLRAGKSYEQLVKERILVPLGMNDTGIQLTLTMKAHMSQGFNEVGSPMHLWDLTTLAGAGALRSTANDMLRFLAANLDSTISPVHRALAVSRRAQRPADRAGNRIGLGWHLVDLFGSTLTWHNGGTGGFRTFIGLDEAKHRGVVVLSNSTTTPDDIGFHLLEPQIPVEAAVQPRKERKEIVLSEAKLESVVGVYQLAPTFQLAISREGKNLFGQATGQGKVPIFAQSETEFFLKVVDAQLTFVKDSTGKATNLVLHQGGQDIPGTRLLVKD